MKKFDSILRLKEFGATPEEAYAAAKQSKLDFAACLKILTGAYGLSLTEAKSVMVEFETGQRDMSAYQATLLPEIEEALTEEIPDD